MFKPLSALLIALALLAACQPAPQPVPTEPPTVPARPTTIIAPTATATLAPTASPVPTAIPTVAPATQPPSTPTPTTAPMLRAQVNSPDVGYLNVRDTPAASGALVAQVKDGTMLDVLDAADTARGQIGQQGQWLKIRTSEGKEGFVAAWYLRLPDTSPAPTLQPTAIPVTPDASGAVLELFNRTNALRAQNGLAAYQLANRLNAAAQRQSEDMANTGNVSDTGSDGSTIKRRVLDAGYGDYPAAENIYGGVVTLDDTWNLWTTDISQRDNLLSQQFRDVGISVVKGKGGTFYYTMVLGGRPLQAPTPATPSPTPASSTDAIQELLNRTNALRAANGLPPYRLNDKLNASAQRHSQDMASTGNIDHTGSDGSTAKRRILDTGYEAQFTGENIYGGMATVDDAWDYWVNDPPHRDILLNKLYTDIGISVVKGKGQTFYYTMDLARPTAP